MKKILVIGLICCSTLLHTFSQNALLDGINNYKEERTDAGGDICSEFNARETGNCTFEFNQRRYVDYIMDYSILYQKITWNWKDVTYISLGDNALDLGADGNNFFIDSKDKSTDVVTPSVEKYITLYFKSTDDAKAAANWIVDKVKKCGGSVLYKP